MPPRIRLDQHTILRVSWVEVARRLRQFSGIANWISIARCSGKRRQSHFGWASCARWLALARSLRLLCGTSSASDQVPLLLRAMSTADAPVLAAAAASEAEGVCLSGSEGAPKTALEVMALESALNKAKARLAVYRAKEGAR